MLCYTIYMANSFIYSPLIQSTNIEYASGLQARHSVYNVSKHRIGVILKMFAHTFDRSITFLAVVLFSLPEPRRTFAFSLLILLHSYWPQIFSHCPAPACNPVLSGFNALISKLGVYQNHPEGLLNHGLGWGPRICFSNMFVDEANGKNKDLRWWGSYKVLGEESLSLPQGCLWPVNLMSLPLDSLELRVKEAILIFGSSQELFWE